MFVSEVHVVPFINVKMLSRDWFLFVLKSNIATNSIFEIWLSNTVVC